MSQRQRPRARFSNKKRSVAAAAILRHAPFVQGREITTDAAVLAASEITRRTLAAYDLLADAYEEQTRFREREADYSLFFRHLAQAMGPRPGAAVDLLDLGCGPGRDLAAFHRRGHRVIGLDGSRRCVDMARAHSGCVVLHQDLLVLDLPQAAFDGVFASATLFHIPPPALPTVLRPLHQALRPQGILFTLHPRGDDRTGWIGDRYACYLRLSTWRRILRTAGFRLIEYQDRPLALPKRRRQWIAAVWQRMGKVGER